MKCIQCGREISADYLNCPYCNAEQDGGEKTIGIWGSNASLSGAMHTPQPAAAAQPSASKSAGEAVGFGEAIGLFFRNYVKFSGRSGRREFWLAMLFVWIIILLIGALSVVFPYAGLLTLAFFLPLIAAYSRRLHDTGKSGWYQLIALIPIAGVILLIIALAKPSDGDNRFGPASGAKKTAEEIPETPDERIYRLTQEHEPRNCNTPNGKKMLDSALSQIIPTYSGQEALASAVIQCNMQDIAANIAAMDTDTLFVINKALRHYRVQSSNPDIIDAIQQKVITILREKI